tara:strand:- start:82 stop:771 length:690 start_codon:yes stop_codon:yes gene_type:complete
MGYGANWTGANITYNPRDPDDYGEDMKLSEIVGKNEDEIMAAYGYDVEVVGDKMRDFLPMYDDYMEGQLSDKYGAEREQEGLRRAGLVNQGELLNKQLGFGQNKLSMQNEAALGQSENNMYGIIQQGRMLAGQGLGARTGATKRAARGVGNQYGAQAGQFALQGQEMQDTTESKLRGLSGKIAGSNLEEKILDAKENIDISGERGRYEKDLFNYFMTLAQHFNIEPADW